MNNIKITPAELKEQIVDKVREYIETERYVWSGTTKRKSGQVVTSPRNIVDMGYLLDNLVDFDLEIDGFTGKVTVTLSDYAILVHSGYVINSVVVAGRPFVADALEDLGLDYSIS